MALGAQVFDIEFQDGVVRLFASDDVFGAARRGVTGLGCAASTADSQQSGDSCGQEVMQGTWYSMADSWVSACIVAHSRHVLS